MFAFFLQDLLHACKKILGVKVGHTLVRFSKQIFSTGKTAAKCLHKGLYKRVRSSYESKAVAELNQNADLRFNVLIARESLKLYVVSYIRAVFLI